MWIQSAWTRRLAKREQWGVTCEKSDFFPPQVTWKHPVPQHWPLWTNHTKSTIVPTKFLQPQTSKPQRNSVNQVTLSVTEPNLGLYWVRYILSPQGSAFFLSEFRVNGKLLETWSQWFVCVWGCKTCRSPNWSHFLKASKHPQQLGLPSCFLENGYERNSV